MSDKDLFSAATGDAIAAVTLAARNAPAGYERLEIMRDSLLLDAHLAELSGDLDIDAVKRGWESFLDAFAARWGRAKLPEGFFGDYAWAMIELKIRGTQS